VSNEGENLLVGASVPSGPEMPRGVPV